MAKEPSARQRLFHWRKGKGLSQGVAAKQIGASQAVWSEWEKGTRRPGPAFREAIERLTGGDVTVENWSAEDSEKTAKKAA